MRQGWLWFEAIKWYGDAPCGRVILRLSAGLQAWIQMDREVEATPMPADYANWTAEVGCNDCHGTCQTKCDEPPLPPPPPLSSPLSGLAVLSNGLPRLVAPCISLHFSVCCQWAFSPRCSAAASRFVVVCRRFSHLH